MESDTTPGNARWILVNPDALPDVFVRTLEAKSFLQSGQAASAAEAARMAGISRAAFYKYRDAVFPYDEEKSGHIVTVHMILQDRTGVLSTLLAAFADAGANILTVNQNIPAGNTASVSISARVDHLLMPMEAFIQSLRQVPGVKQIARVSGETG